MFEQSVIPVSSRGRRLCSAGMGVTGQALVVAGMVVAPLLWPQTMPPVSYTLLVPTAPVGHKQGQPAAKARVTQAVAHRPYIPRPGLVQPSAVPMKIEIVNDGNLAPVGSNSSGPYIPGVIEGTGGNNALLTELMRAGQDVHRPAVAARNVETPKPVAAAVLRVTTGGRVREPRLIQRVEPRYPPLAIAARVQGTVNLRGVIAVDGRIAELAIESGNALLVPAAMEAVRQWIYEPTLLNEQPVEVATRISVTFILNH